MTNQQTALLLMNLRARLWGEREALQKMLIEARGNAQYTRFEHRGPYTKECDNPFMCDRPDHMEEIYTAEVISLDGLDAFIADLDGQIELLKMPNTVAAY